MIVQAIINQALQEIGALGQGEVASASDSVTALGYLQNQIDAWNAERLTIATQLRETFSLLANTNTYTIGLTGQIVAPRPTWVNGINYVVPGTSPAVETPMGKMDQDAFMNLSIKSLPSSLPTQWYYNGTVPNGTLFFWPDVTQTVTLAVYYPPSLGVPTGLGSDLSGPPGYQEAFMYQLALRLVTPWGQAVPPLLPGNAAEAFARMKRPNVMPGVMGIDSALVATSGGYNVLNDSVTAPSNR